MVIDVQEIGRAIKREFSSRSDRQATSGPARWRPVVLKREEMAIFMRRFGITFRETFTEWKRWAWPGTQLLSAPVSSRKREEQLVVPQIGISRLERLLVVRAELPGVRGEDVRVEFFDGVLILSGEYRVVGKGNAAGVETFFRTLTLPDGITGHNATIEFGEGRLEISMMLPELEEMPRPAGDA